MTRRYALPLISFAVGVFVLTGCPSDPYDPQTWIDKLDDPSQVDRAITELQRLKDPVAIKPLSKTWRDQNKPQRVLRVIIELASRVEDGKGPHWEDALPTLRSALEDFDVGDQRSIENAIIAAEALGQAKDKESIQTLINAVNKVMPKLSPGQRVRLTAIRALGKFGNEPRSVAALLKVLKAEPKNQRVELFAASAIALSDARSPKATLPLIEALFKIAIIYPQARRALIAIGAPVVPELIKIFKNEHKELNALAKKYKFNIECERGIGPDSTCQAPSNLQYKAALLLGDLHAKDAVKPMLAELKKPALPSYFQEGLPGPSQHTAVLDALRKIGDKSAAKAVWAYANDEKQDITTRPIALDVYSFLTTSTDNLSALAKLIKNEDAEDQMRMSAGLTYGRLARSSKQYEPLTHMIGLYKKKAKEKDAEFEKKKKAYDAAKKAFDEANAKLASKPDDKKLKKAVKTARSKMDVKGEEKSIAETYANAALSFQRTFEQNLARAHVGSTCKKDPQCYIGVLDKTADDLLKELGKYIKDAKEWSDTEKKNLQVAATERALLELGKMGESARPVFDKMLERVESTDRIVRQGILMAMVKTAQLPCKKCVDRLDAVIKDQKENTALGELTVETQAIRNYFLWAGTK